MGSQRSVKLLVICLGALVVTVVMYDMDVRRTRLTRFLFGIEPERQVSVPVGSGGDAPDG